MQLTKEHFDEAIKKFVREDDFAVLTENVVFTKAEVVFLKEDFGEQKNVLSEIQRTLNTHTSALDKLLKDMENRENERLITIQRFDRLESWARQVSEKVGIKIDF